MADLTIGLERHPRIAADLASPCRQPAITQGYGADESLAIADAPSADYERMTAARTMCVTARRCPVMASALPVSVDRCGHF
jgi:hypothetical protein